MTRARSLLPAVFASALCCALVPPPAGATPPAGQSAQPGPGAQVPAPLDLPLPAGQAARYVGTYPLTGPGSNKPMTLTLTEDDGLLVGRINQNDPTRMLYQGGDSFRPEDAPVFEVRFTLEDGRASRVDISSPGGPLSGPRAEADTATSGPLFEALARLDAALFQAAFVDCDTAARNALFTDDIEFYHDRSGFEPASKVRAPITACPAADGMTRQLVPGSLRVYPLAGYGAVQTGMHRFSEGDGEVTVARFTHLWRKTDAGWKIARVLSYDHQTTRVPAPAGTTR